MGVSAVASALSSDASRGLDPAVAASHLARLARKTPNDVVHRLGSALKDLVVHPQILIVLALGLICALLSGFEEGVTIVVMLVAVVLACLANGVRGEGALTSLRCLDEPLAPLLRDGRRAEVPARQVVPGDLLLLEVGKRIPADARLVDSCGLVVDESSVIGGSSKVLKEAGTLLDPQTPLPARSNLVYAGDMVLQGRATALAVSAGQDAGVGGAALREGVLGTRGTTAQRDASEKSWVLAGTAAGLSVLVALLSFLLVQESASRVLLIGLSLSFAAIPDELPQLVALGQALGALGLSREHVVIRDLQAVENLASVTVIVSDETRTMLVDKLDLKKVFPQTNRRQIIELGLLSEAEAAAGHYPSAYDSGGGGTLTSALSPSATEEGLSTERVRNGLRVLRLFTLDEVRKISSTAYGSAQGVLVVAKGAPESLLARSTRELGSGGEHVLLDTDRDAILMAANKMAAEGLEVLGLAEKRLENPPAAQDDAEFDLTFVGLAAFARSVKPEARGVVTACREAGIRLVMVTGDHPLTAVSVAMETGIQETRDFIAGPELDSMNDSQLDECVKGNAVFARITPDTELRIIGSLQRTGHVVAATGDRIDDARSIAAADVGVAMGLTNDLAREASDVVIADNEFATAVDSTTAARRILGHLSRAVRYYLSCKLALVLACLLPVLLLAPVPFVPIQLVTIALFVDLGASVAFTPPLTGLDSKEAATRTPGAKLLSRTATAGIAKSATGLFLAVITVYLLTWHYAGNLPRAESAAFVTWLLGLPFMALNMGSDTRPMTRKGFYTYTPMVVWAAAAIALAAVSVTLPAAQGVFGTVTLGLRDWALVLPLSVAGTWWMELKKMVSSRRG